MSRSKWERFHFRPFLFQPRHQADIQPHVDAAMGECRICRTFGWGGPHDFTSEEWLEKLGSPQARYAELRRTLYNQFRKLPRDGISPLPWPWLYGDLASVVPVHPNSHLVLGATQMANLSAWADGNFIGDYPPTGAPSPRSKILVLRQRCSIARR